MSIAVSESPPADPPLSPGLICLSPSGLLLPSQRQSPPIVPGVVPGVIPGVIPAKSESESAELSLEMRRRAGLPAARHRAPVGRDSDRYLNDG